MLDQQLQTRQQVLEFQLVEIWEELLDTRPIGVTDNFFQLGGHSLLAVRLFKEIETRFHKHLPLVTLFQRPTVTDLAHALASEPGVGPWESLVPIQPGGTRIPFFCIHAIDGDIVCYSELASQLGPDQPLYGLRARGLDGEQEPHTSVAEMAAHYVAELRRFQPEGPYHLGGFSAGALIAFEMARQLRDQQQRVGLVAILDQVTFMAGGKASWSRCLRNLVGNFVVWLHDFVRCSHQERFTRMWDRVRTLKNSLRQLCTGQDEVDAHTTVMIDDWLSGVPGHRREARRRFFEIHAQAYQAYEPRHYGGKVVLFWARRQPLLAWNDPLLAANSWPAERVDVRVIPSSHLNMLRNPYVRTLAGELAVCLSAAGGGAQTDGDRGDD